jgi:hypothetical protein
VLEGTEHNRVTDEEMKLEKSAKNILKAQARENF